MAQASSTKAVKIQLRRAAFGDGRPEALEARLRLAFNVQDGGSAVQDDFKLRQWEQPVDESEEVFHLLCNHIRDSKGATAHKGHSYLFGDVVSFRPQGSQPVVDESKSQKEMHEETVVAGDDKHFLDTKSYWFVCGNDVCILNGHLMKRSAIEEYFLWLLRKYGSMSSDESLILIPLTKLTAAKAKQTDVKRLTIGRLDNGALVPVLGDASPERERQRSTGIVGTTRRVLGNVLEALTGDAEKSAQLAAQFPDQALNLQLVIGFKDSRRAKKPSVDEVTAITRNLPDTEVSIDTAVGKMKGEEMRRTHSAKIAIVDRALDRNDVLRAMIEAQQAIMAESSAQPV